MTTVCFLIDAMSDSTVWSDLVETHPLCCLASLPAADSLAIMMSKTKKKKMVMMRVE